MYQSSPPHLSLTAKLIDSLYCEALLLADEARATFERSEPDLPARAMLLLSCESLKVTTRLMQVIAWLLSHKAYRAGELTLSELYADERALGYAVASDAQLVAQLPPEPARLARLSEDLYYRVHRMAGRLTQQYREAEPVHAMMDRLEAAF